MKKTFVALLFTLPSLGFSQELLDTYYNPFDELTYNISIELPDKKGIYVYWIECLSLDSRSTKPVLFIKSNQSNDFKAYINSLKETFTKWSETARTNNVIEFEKEIPYKGDRYSAAFNYGDWQLDSNVKLSARFKTIKGKFFIIVNSDSLVSGTNQFIKSKGFVLTFEKESDFDDLIEKVNDVEAMKVINAKLEKDYLFKN